MALGCNSFIGMLDVPPWSFIKAWPVKWVVADLKATDNAIVIETIELAYQYFRRGT